MGVVLSRPMTRSDFKLLQSISLPSFDNGEIITDRTRLDKIEEIVSQNASYRKISAPLFTLYTKKPISELPEDVLLISTHIDASEEITKFYAEEKDDETVHGTFDNTITNAAALSLMMDNAFADQVAIAFTANEEKDSRGAIAVAEYLMNEGKHVYAIVLDVTDVGYREADFTIENNFYHDYRMHQAIRAVIRNIPIKFRFVPENYLNIPEYIKLGRVEKYSDGGIKEALPDESWDYDELGVECFSLCLPTKGEMHSDDGIDCFKNSFSTYKNIVQLFANSISTILKYEKASRR